MKIGVLTLPLTDNYGGILQAVALCSHLEAQGHEVTLIQKPNSSAPNAGLRALKAIIKKLLLLIPFHDFGKLRSNQAKYKAWTKKVSLHRPFIESTFRKISLGLHTTEDLRRFAEAECFDAIIVGSDQVWRKQYINDRHYQSYFLDFVDGKKCRKIAYAASFGTNHWEGSEDAERIGALLKDFTAVSTREQSGTRICRDTFGYPGTLHLLDPTLIMSREFYVTQIIEKHVSTDFKISGLLTYVLDEETEKADIIRRAMEVTGSAHTTHLKGFNTSGHTYSVPEWLASFHQADFIVTDSFHGMIFSIIFEKNFIAIGNKGRGLERFTSLLSQLGLDDRLVFDTSDLNPSLFVPIDYTRVNETLLTLKNRSTCFLADALKEIGT